LEVILEIEMPYEEYLDSVHKGLVGVSLRYCPH